MIRAHHAASLSFFLHVLPGCSSSAPTPSDDPAAPFVGAWSYAHPDLGTGEGIAVLRCPATPASPALSLPLPQIGWIDFRRPSAGALSGTTDQGCTWSFAANGRVASLDPPAQTCFNHNIGSSYTITDWTVSLTQDGQASESLHAISHQATDCTFTLDRATRRRAGAAGGDLTAPFVGTWSYQAPDAEGGNVAIVTCAGDGGAAGTPSYLPQSGTLHVAKVDDATVSVTTGQGCTSTLGVRDHTAELAKPASTCASGVVPTFWSLETDGTDAFQTISGTTNGCFFVLSNSHLTRSP